MSQNLSIINIQYTCPLDINLYKQYLHIYLYYSSRNYFFILGLLYDNTWAYWHACWDQRAPLSNKRSFRVSVVVCARYVFRRIKWRHLFENCLYFCHTKYPLQWQIFRRHCTFTVTVSVSSTANQFGINFSFNEDFTLIL